MNDSLMTNVFANEGMLKMVKIDAIGLDVLTFCFDHDVLHIDDVLL